MKTHHLFASIDKDICSKLHFYIIDQNMIFFVVTWLFSYAYGCYFQLNKRLFFEKKLILFY